MQIVTFESSLPTRFYPRTYKKGNRCSGLSLGTSGLNETYWSSVCVRLFVDWAIYCSKRCGNDAVAFHTPWDFARIMIKCAREWVSHGGDGSVCHCFALHEWRGVSSNAPNECFCGCQRFEREANDSPKKLPPSISMQSHDIDFMCSRTSEISVDECMPVRYVTLKLEHGQIQFFFHHSVVRHLSTEQLHLCATCPTQDLGKPVAKECTVHFTVVATNESDHNVFVPPSIFRRKIHDVIRAKKKNA